MNIKKQIANTDIEISECDNPDKFIIFIDSGCITVTELEWEEIVKFIIKQHSLSSTENINNLNSLFETKIQQEIEEKMAKMQLWMKKEDTEQKVRNSVAKIFEKMKMHFQKVLEIFKDADKLDRVRLDVYGINPRDGLDINRLSLRSSKSFENIAYEAFDKIIEILDIEHELVDINRKISEIEEVTTLETEVSQFNIFEEKIDEAKLAEQNKKKGVLNDIVANRRLSKISDFPKKIKDLFLHKNNEYKR